MPTMFDVELYGAYRTLTFGEIFENVEQLQAEYAESPLYLSELNMPIIYALLYANYGNSHISNSDINQFKYRLYGILFMYGPSWQKRLDIQTKLRELSDEEIRKGGGAVYNHAMNDGSAPSSDTTKQLDYINDQNTTHYTKSALEGYATLLSVIRTDVTKEFIDRFRPLFLKIVAPEAPLLYPQ